jgi:hypothetical protein
MPGMGLGFCGPPLEQPLLLPFFLFENAKALLFKGSSSFFASPKFLENSVSWANADPNFGEGRGRRKKLPSFVVVVSLVASARVVKVRKRRGSSPRVHLESHLESHLDKNTMERRRAELAAATVPQPTGAVHGMIGPVAGENLENEEEEEEEEDVIGRFDIIRDRPPQQKFLRDSSVPKRIERIEFGLLSPAELVRLSVLRVTARDLYEHPQHKPVQGIAFFSILATFLCRFRNGFHFSFFFLVLDVFFSQSFSFPPSSSR